MNIEEKTKMAHEYAMSQIESPNSRLNTTSLLVEFSWDYADAMEAEAEKRLKAEAKEKREAVRKLLNDNGTFLEKEGEHFDDVATLCKTYSSSEWQPDWSVAPENAEEWSVERGGVDARWTCYGRGDKYYVPAPLFNYRGDWKDSLRKRP